MTPGMPYHQSEASPDLPTLQPTPAGGKACPKSADTASLVELATAELEGLDHTNNCTTTPTTAPTTTQEAATEEARHTFPVACKALLHELEGNSRCLDCNAKNPEWAAVSYGALVCLQCAGKHRSLGVTVSVVRSVAMDHWRQKEIVQMLEGGNAQLASFFQRHHLHAEASTFHSSELTASNIQAMRYKTKAALFYRQQLDHHVRNLLAKGPYKGRAAARRNAHSRRRPLGTQTSNLE